MIARKRSAFTLVEILATLLVIGFVSAMTIPTLISMYNKKAQISALKVGYSTISNAFRQAMIDEVVSDFRDTSLFEECSKFQTIAGTGESDIEGCVREFTKYVDILDMVGFKEVRQALPTASTSLTGNDCTQDIIGKYAWYNLNNQTKCYAPRVHYLKLFNNMVINLSLGDKNTYAGLFVIDINGKSGPNTWGRDVFQFYVLNDGTIVPRGSKEAADATGTPYWKSSNVCSSTTTEVGRECAGRVIEENWKMNY